MFMKIGIQMYTLRDLTEKDFKGTVEKVAAIGYEGIELAGYGGLSSDEMKALLQRIGLKALGSHVGMDRLKEHLDEEIAYNKAIGSTYLVCPYMEYKSQEQFRETATILNEIGEKVKTHGLQLCYHNHAQEFQQFGDLFGLDILFNETSSDNLQAEIDTYWVQFAGHDPVAYLKKYKSRCPLLHQKDMADDEKKSFCEVGNGIMDIPAIIEAAGEIGVEWFIVEQDSCQRPPLDSIKMSYEYLKKNGL
ncbi:MAG: sugar phosphate isomerase/epimerase [Clostridia bacterium]|nr:sugar phosphate isomerase/epimerase [Clostridia bacterium]